jgi:tetratricopeptide (TPR) repeat protein
MWSRLSVSYWWERTTVHLLELQHSQLNTVELYPPSEELVEYSANEALVLGLTPFRRFSEFYMRRALEWARELGSLRAEGRALCFYAVGLLAEGRYTESLCQSFRAIQAIEQSGDLFILRMTEINAGHIFYRTGNLRQAKLLLEKYFYKTREFGDVANSTDCLVTWTKVTAGDVPEGLIEQAEASITPGNCLSKAVISNAKAIRSILLGRPEEAIKSLEFGLKICRENYLLNEYCAPLAHWYVSALRLRIESTPTSARKELLPQAFRAARKAISIAKQFGNNMPHVLREIALLHALAGDSKKSKHYFGLSTELALKTGMRYEHAHSLLEFGRVGLALGWAEAEVCIENAENLLKQLGANMHFHRRRSFG